MAGSSLTVRDAAFDVLRTYADLDPRDRAFAESDHLALGRGRRCAIFGCQHAPALDRGLAGDRDVATERDEDASALDDVAGGSGSKVGRERLRR